MSKQMRQAIQQAYYQEAKNPSLNNILVDCAKELADNMSQFKCDLMSRAIDEELTEQIQFSRVLGVHSYPSLRLRLNNINHTIPIDYNNAKLTMSRIDIILNKKTDHYKL